MNHTSEKKADALISNNVLNCVCLIGILLSISVGIVTLTITILAYADVQILSWSIGYIVASSTNEAIRGTYLAITLVCAAVLALCLLKNRIIRAVAGR